MNTKRKYEVFKVGGDPDDEWKLSQDLKDTVEELQENGYTIERIDNVQIHRAYSPKQGYVPTTEYVIVAYK